MELKDKIKHLRLAQHKTLEDVAKQVGVGKSTVRKWENGDIANMRRDKIAKLAKALDTTPGYLMGWDEARTNLNIAGLSLSNVAEEMNLPVDTLVHILEGEEPLEAVDTIVRVANALSEAAGPVKVAITPREYALLLLYRAASAKEKSVVDTVLGLE